jgi:hypothetical protein
VIDELLSYAREHFVLARSSGKKTKTISKAPLAAHLRQLAKSKGREPSEVLSERFEKAEAPEEPPEELNAVWCAFLEMDDARTVGQDFRKLDFEAISWWQNVTGILLEAWEVRVVRALDNVCMEVWYNG